MSVEELKLKKTAFLKESEQMWADFDKFTDKKNNAAGKRFRVTSNNLRKLLKELKDATLTLEKEGFK